MRVRATPHTRAAELALDIYTHVLESVRADRLVRSALEFSGDLLFIQGQPFDLSQFQRVFVFGSGKAAVPMAEAVRERLGSRVEACTVVTPEGTDAPSGISVLPGGHPVPNEDSVRSGEEMLRLVTRLGEDDFVIYVLSGGSSALMEAPVQGIDLADLQDTNRALLASGMDIRAMNAVRKRLSRIKGGGLARAFAPATVVCLVLSDVVGNDVQSVGSGPLAEAPKGDLPFWQLPALPERVVSALEEVRLYREVPPVPHFVIGSVSLAIQEASQYAKSLGLKPLAYGDPLKGEARVMARRICLEAEARLQAGEGPFCMVFGGETTVKIRGSGLGGRCQEMVVASAMRLHRMENCCFLAAGTDGLDGPTTAAGGFADGLTCERAVERGQEVRATLRNNDAYHFLAEVDGLIETGPTGSNVNDIVLFVHSSV